jgi:hypothetical protein
MSIIELTLGERKMPNQKQKRSKFTRSTNIDKKPKEEELKVLFEKVLAQPTVSGIVKRGNAAIAIT